MNRLLGLAFMISAVSPAIASPAEAATIPVDIAFMEAAPPGDIAASERFQADLDLAIRITKDFLSKRLSSCGYNFRTHTTFYDSTDPKQTGRLRVAAARAGAWMIVGPRRSNPYLALAREVKSTPTVSLMASASEISELGPEHLSLSTSNIEMAQIAATEALRRMPSGKPREFVSIVSRDCVSCEDFAIRFLTAARKIGFKQTERIDVSGDAPETAGIIARIKKLKPAFILLPNYSRTSGHLITALQPSMGASFFVGSDGWGDARFGFLQGDPGIRKARGFTVRGFPPVQEGLARFQLGRTILTNARPNTYPLSSASLAILKAMDGAAELLCSGKPKDAAGFRAEFRKNARKHFSAPWGVSIYDLDGTDIRFNRSVPLPGQASGS